MQEMTHTKSLEDLQLLLNVLAIQLTVYLQITRTGQIIH